MEHFIGPSPIIWEHGAFLGSPYRSLYICSPPPPPYPNRRAEGANFSLQKQLVYLKKKLDPHFFMNIFSRF